MSSAKWLPVLAGLLVVGVAGCSKSGTVFGGGNTNRSVKFVRVSEQIEVVNVPRLVKRGNATYFDVILRNNDEKRKAWDLEYSFKFYNADGKEVPSATRGWRGLTIGRGENKTIGGCCLISGAETALCIIRKWNRKN
jgi:Protein of unknown function (DUF1425)